MSRRRALGAGLSLLTVMVAWCIFRATAQPPTGTVRITPTPVRPAALPTLAVREMTGKVEIRPRGAAAWRVLPANGVVPPDNQVRTHPQSIITFDWRPTGSWVKLAPLTMIELRGRVLFVRRGRVWLAAKQRRGEPLILLAMQSPFASVATYRGYVCLFHQRVQFKPKSPPEVTGTPPPVIERDIETTVSVDEGEAAVAALGRAVKLKGGQMSFIYPNMPPTPPRMMTCEGLSHALLLRLEKVAREQNVPPRLLPQEYLLCIEKMIWDGGGAQR